MGYYIFSFGIKEKEILEAFKSKDEELIKKTEKNEYFQNYSEDEDHKGVNTKTALHDIIQGNKLLSTYNHIYGYALISICATLGKELPYGQEIKLGYETDFINKFLSEDFQLKDFYLEEELLAENSHAFPIPKIEEWPLLGLVRYKDLQALKNKLSAVKVTELQIEELIDSEEEIDEEKGYSYEHIKGVIDNINYCIDNELDLLSICH